MRFYCGPTLLVVDELGYLPMQAEAAAALFEVVQRRYLKGSIILTTNRGIPSWGQIFDDPMIAAAMLDRLLHRSVVVQIDGDSYRMRAHHARSENLRRALNPRIRSLNPETEPLRRPLRPCEDTGPTDRMAENSPPDPTRTLGPASRSPLRLALRARLRDDRDAAQQTLVRNPYTQPTEPTPTWGNSTTRTEEFRTIAHIASPSFHFASCATSSGTRQRLPGSCGCFAG